MATCRLEIPAWFGFRVYVCEVTADTYLAAKKGAWTHALLSSNIKWRTYPWQIWYPEVPTEDESGLN